MAAYVMRKYAILLTLISTMSYHSECYNIPETVNSELTLCKPEQIHLSTGSRFNQIYVMWATKVNETQYVEYGNNLTKFPKVQAEHAKLTKNSENAAKFVHRAELPNLEPGTRYWYSIVCEASRTQTERFTFEVPHNNPDKPDRFVVIADVGLITKSLKFLVHEVLNGGYEVVFHIGDIAYNLDSNGGLVGDEYLKKIDNFTARVPYLTTPGDHEIASGFFHYRHRFSMPNAPWPMTEDSLWYSIDIGHTHFISINTQLTTNSHLSNIQFQWLKNDLINANQNRQIRPWIIVMGHKPLYCTKSVMPQDCDQERSSLREQFEDLFFESGVDLYLSGHKHCYERSWPMYRSRVFQTDTINPKAPIYIITGTTGYEYLVDRQYSNPFWLAYAATDAEKELYARLTVVNGTHLIWSVHAIMSNEQIENVQIIQNHHGSFGKAGPSAFPETKMVPNKRVDLPPEPFYIVDAEGDNQHRRIVLYSTVLILFLLIVIFLRSVKLRKILWLRH